MTRDEARTLATRLCQGWPKGLSATAWEDAIGNLDPGTAGTAFIRLQATVNDPTGPTVAAFLALYNSLDTRRPEHHADCPTCDNNGWEYIIAIDDDGLERTVGVHPCRCPRGRQYDNTWQTVIDRKRIA